MLLHDDDLHVMCAAIVSLGKLYAEAYREPIEELTKHADVEVQIAAYDAITNLDNPAYSACCEGFRRFCFHLMLIVLPSTINQNDLVGKEQNSGSQIEHE